MITARQDFDRRYSPQNDTVTVISTVSNMAIKTINVGRGAGAIAITPNGRTAYGLGGMSGTVTPIRTATSTALKAIQQSGWASSL